MYETVNADKDKDQCWVATSNFLLNISMKKKKLIERLRIGLPITELQMAGKFLVGFNTGFPPHSLIAFDTENGDLKSSFDETAMPFRVLFLDGGVISNMVSDGKTVMISIQNKSCEFNVFIAEKIENQYPHTNLTLL